MASRTMKERHKRARGGKADQHIYNAQGSPEMEEAHDEKPGFKKGGRKRKHGGHAEGMEAKMRGDKKPRGRHAKGGHAKRNAEGEFEKAKHGGSMHEEHRMKRASGGRTPYSSGSETKMPSIGGKTDTGHESQRPPEA